MKCQVCNISFKDAKCPDGCLESNFCLTLDAAGYRTRMEDDVWREDVVDTAMEVSMFVEYHEDEDSQGILPEKLIQIAIEKICGDYTDGWFDFLKKPFMYDVTKKYCKMK